jgi:hypothetical protein
MIEGSKTGRWSVKGCVPTLERWNDKKDILAFLYTTGEKPNPEDELLNQVGDDEMDGDCDEEE